MTLRSGRLWATATPVIQGAVKDVAMQEDKIWGGRQPFNQTDHLRKLAGYRRYRPVLRLFLGCYWCNSRIVAGIMQAKNSDLNIISWVRPNACNCDHDSEHHLEHAAKHQKPHSSHHNMRGLFPLVMNIIPKCTRPGKQGSIKFCISSRWQDGKMQSFHFWYNGGSFLHSKPCFFVPSSWIFLCTKLGPSETCQAPGLGTGFPCKKVPGKLALLDWWPGSLKAFTIKTIQNARVFAKFFGAYQLKNLLGIGFPNKKAQKNPKEASLHWNGGLEA